MNRIEKTGRMRDSESLGPMESGTCRVPKAQGDDAPWQSGVEWARFNEAVERIPTASEIPSRGGRVKQSSPQSPGFWQAIGQAAVVESRRAAQLPGSRGSGVKVYRAGMPIHYMVD